MPQKAVLPPPLPVALAGPLVAAAQTIAALKPWEFMSDSELIGLRAKITGELRVATVLGALKEVFAVIIYRGAAGIGWLHRTVTADGPVDTNSALDGMDFLKVEWCRKNELETPDLQMLAAVNFKPVGRGCVWPRFQSATPGWLPWFLSESEAIQLTQDLNNVARLVRLRLHHPSLYEPHDPGDIAMVPDGEKELAEAELNWQPLIPPPRSPEESMTLLEDVEQELKALPIRRDSVLEILTAIIPKAALLDEEQKRPSFSRLALVSDRDSFYVLAVELSHAKDPLHVGVGNAFYQALQKGNARPVAIHVTDERLVQILGPISERIGVPLKIVPQLQAAPDALSALITHFAQMKP